MGDQFVHRNRNVSQGILDAFPKLYSNDNKIRLSSAAKLSQLIIKEKEKSTDGFMYSLERLIKGTMSPKDATKIGSTVLLTEMLHSIEKFQVSLLMSMAKEIIGDVNGDLSTEGVTAWTLIFTSVVQSGRLDISDKRTVKELVRFMVTLGDKKPLCNVAICNLFEDLFSKKFDHDNFAKVLNSSLEINESGDPKPFHLYIMLLIHKRPKFSQVLDKLPPVDLDDPENLAEYVKASTSYLPSVHPACIELFHHLNQNEKMEVFWKPTFNDILFGHDHSNDYHRLGFELVADILPYLTEENAHLIFSRQMLNLWRQCLSNPNQRLNGVSRKLGEKLIDNYKKYSPPLQTNIITLMTEDPGTVSFDAITRTDIVNRLYVETKAEAVATLVDHVIQKIRQYKATSGRDKMRSLYVGQLRDLLKSSHISESLEIRINVLTFFLTHGYFDVSSDESLKLNATPTEGLKEKMQTQFFKCLSTSMGNNLDILEKVGYHVIKFIKADIPCYNSKVTEFWRKVKKLKTRLKKLKNEDKNDKQLKIFVPLLYGVALCSFQDANDLDQLTDTFEELYECLKRSLGESEDENEPKWPDVLLDIMIAQFSRQSVFLASLMTKVFRLIVQDLTKEGIEQLRIALLAQKLGDDDDEPVSSDEDEDGEEKSGEIAGSDESEVEEEEEEEIDEDDEDDTVDDEFRARVRLALGPAADVADDESDVDIDDEEMFQLDEALADAFRTKYAKQDRKSQETLRMLRSRCLDLVEVILKVKEPSLDIILQLIPALLEAGKIYGGAKDGELRSKVAKILTHLPAAKSFKTFESLNSKIAQSIFKRAIDLAWKIDDQGIQKGSARTCLWIASLAKHANFETDWMVDQFVTLISDFFNKTSCCVNKVFFILIFQSQQGLDVRILKALQSQSFSNLRPYLKINGLALMSAYLKCLKDSGHLDKSIKNGLISVRDEAVKGILEAISGNKSALVNEYLILLFVLSKLIPLNLSPEEINAINKMSKIIRVKLTKQGKSIRKRLVSVAQKNWDSLSVPISKENPEDGDEEMSEEDDESENDEISEQDEAQTTPAKKMEKGPNNITSQSKSIENKKVTPSKSMSEDKKPEETFIKDDKEKNEKIQKKTPEIFKKTSKPSTPIQEIKCISKDENERENDKDEDEETSSLEIINESGKKSPTKGNNTTPGELVNKSFQEEKSTKVLFDSAKKKKQTESDDQDESEESDSIDESSEEQVPTAPVKSPNTRFTEISCDLSPNNKVSEDEVTILSTSGKLFSVDQGSAKKRKSLESKSESVMKTDEVEGSPKKVPKQSSSTSLTENIKTLNGQDEVVIEENVTSDENSQHKTDDDTTPDKPDAKKLKNLEVQKDDEGHIVALRRTTRSYAKTPKVDGIKEEIDNAKSEHELLNFNIPRVEVIQTPRVVRSRKRSATPTVEADAVPTPLRRSLRIRK